MIKCERCGGTVVRDTDYYGTHDRCIMCGKYKDYTAKLVVPPELKGHMKRGRKKLAKNVQVNMRRNIETY